MHPGVHVRLRVDPSSASGRKTPRRIPGDPETGLRSLAHERRPPLRNGGGPLTKHKPRTDRTYRWCIAQHILHRTPQTRSDRRREGSVWADSPPPSSRERQTLCTRQPPNALRSRRWSLPRRTRPDPRASKGRRETVGVAGRGLGTKRHKQPADEGPDSTTPTTSNSATPGRRDHGLPRGELAGAKDATRDECLRGNGTTPPGSNSKGALTHLDTTGHHMTKGEGTHSLPPRKNRQGLDTLPGYERSPVFLAEKGRVWSFA